MKCEYCESREATTYFNGRMLCGECRNVLAEILRFAAAMPQAKTESLLAISIGRLQR